jgi:hypothetical protein
MIQESSQQWTILELGLSTTMTLKTEFFFINESSQLTYQQREYENMGFHTSWPNHILIKRIVPTSLQHKSRSLRSPNQLQRSNGQWVLQRNTSQHLYGLPWYLCDSIIQIGFEPSSAEVCWIPTPPINNSTKNSQERTVGTYQIREFP